MHGRESRSPVLEARGVWREFGGVTALRDVSLSVWPREIVALIGPNGAGKTTLLNLLSCILAPSRGEVVVHGRPLSAARSLPRWLGRWARAWPGLAELWSAGAAGQAPHRANRLGLTRTFQNLQLFGSLTVVENVLVATEARRGREAAPRSAALRCLELVGLAGRIDEWPNQLPFGQRRLLELARALATEPSILLLDEPAAGLSGAERLALRDLLLAIRERGVTVLLVEHDLELVLGLADRVVVLDHGEKIADGPPAEVRRDPRVISAYVGVAA